MSPLEPCQASDASFHDEHPNTAPGAHFFLKWLKKLYRTRDRGRPPPSLSFLTNPETSATRWHPRSNGRMRGCAMTRLTWTPFSFSTSEFVSPRRNHSSSSTTPRQKTFLVVNRGMVLLRRLNLICTPNLEIVPACISERNNKEFGDKRQINLISLTRSALFFHLKEIWCTRPSPIRSLHTIV